MKAFLTRAERWQVVLLLVLPAVWSTIVFADWFFTDADSYFHVGVARRFLDDGWVRTFEWLPHSTLHDPYPDMYLLQHLALVPLVAVFGPGAAVQVGVLVLSSAFALSVYLVLRRRGVRWAAPWVVLGLLGCPLALTYSVFLKGTTSFLVLLPWFIDAVWAGNRRRTFVLAWVSVYLYVGATVLLPFALVHVVVVRLQRGTWERGAVACVGATIAGVVVGMVVNPAWPAHWGYVLAELRTIFERDPSLVPGEYRGAEWAIMQADVLVKLSGLALVAWAVVLVRQLGRAGKVSEAGVSGAIAALGLLGAGMLSGTKMVELFLVFSFVAVPVIAVEMRPWPRWAVAGAVAVGAAMATWSVTSLREQMMGMPGLARGRDYEVMAGWLGERTKPTEMVVAPWDDMPGLFLFGGDQRYMAGMNVQFLRDADRKRFEAYALFYRGMIRDPEQAMTAFFDGARYVLVRRIPHFPGEPALLAGLAANPAFEELASPSQVWRVFRMKAAEVQPAPAPPDPAVRR